MAASPTAWPSSVSFIVQTFMPASPAPRRGVAGSAVTISAVNAPETLLTESPWLMVVIRGSLAQPTSPLDEVELLELDVSPSLDEQAARTIKKKEESERVTRSFMIALPPAGVHDLGRILERFEILSRGRDAFPRFLGLPIQRGGQANPDGTTRVSTIFFYMAGVWQVTVTPNARREPATFTLCLP